MIAREIIHTCSNAHVARAALASIGGEFAARIAASAHRTNLATGVFVASVVRDFSTRAGDEEWDGVDQAVRGADQPILSGLRHILSQRLDDRRERDSFVEGLCAPWISGLSAAGCCAP